MKEKKEISTVNEIDLSGIDLSNINVFPPILK